MRYLSLRRLASTPTNAHSGIDVRLYADTDGALKTIDHDGAVTEVAGGGGGGSVPFVGASAPGSPSDGDLWWDTDDDTAAGGEQLIQSQAFSLTAQQIKDSTLTPHTIIPAQGAGTLVVPTMYVFNFVAGATPFSSSYLELVIGDFNANTLVTFLTSSTDEVGWVFGPRNLDTGAFVGVGEGGDPADYLNKPIRLRAGLRGSIVESQLGAGVSTGYAVGDTGTVDDGSPNATYVITAVAGESGVGSFTITDGGDGYNLGSGGSGSEWTTTPGGAQPGAGSGFTVIVTSVDASGSAGDGTLTGTVDYTVKDLS